MSDTTCQKSYKMDTIRSPFDNIFNMISGLPQGHEKPLKHALYNALALLLLCVCCAVGWALYLILEPFVKPLIWALLVGSVLHPIKYNLTRRIKTWFNKLESTSTPVFFGVLRLPLDIANDASELVGNQLLKKLKLIVAFGVAVPSIHLLYNYTPRYLINLTWKLAYVAYYLVSLLMSVCTSSVILVFLLFYISAIFVYWRPEVSVRFHYASLGVWLLLSCYISSFAESYSIHIFVFFQILYLAGFIVEFMDFYDEIKNRDKNISFIKSLTLAMTTDKKDIPNLFKTDEVVKKQSITAIESAKKSGSSSTLHSESEDVFELELFKKPKKQSSEENKEIEKQSESAKITEISPTSSEQSLSSEVPEQKVRPRTVLTSTGRLHSLNSNIPVIRRSFVDSYIISRLRQIQDKTCTTCETYTSDYYLYGVFWACCIMIIWKHVILLAVLPVPILIYIIKHSGHYLGVWTYLYSKILGFYKSICDWCKPRTNAFIPIHIRGIFKILNKANAQIEETLKGSIDSVASIVVILGLIVFLTCASIFVFIQVYAEAIMLVQVASNVVNSTVVHNPELRQMLPPGWDDTIDSLLDNAYTYGREGISKAMRSMMHDVEDAKAAKLEQQVLELWDRVYQAWISTDDNDPMGPKVTSHAVQHSWNSFVEDLQKSPEMFNVNGLIEFVKQNIGTLMSLLESVWSILKGNISLVVGSFSAFLSVILGGGTAVLNFILNIIVFLTTLFYLLSASGVLYKPVEMLSSFSPSNGSRFGLALEQAINGVFKATGKMAVFYGLWTWFIHNLFDVKVVYLPSALATILGAVPFLGPYWACLPAVLNLWLAQEQPILACLFLIFQFAPVCFVDTTIYQEIKGGGHPYLTALAIAGGIFWLGFEGAIIGPLLLCGLFVAVDLSSSLFRETPSEERSIPLRLQRMDSVL